MKLKSDITTIAETQFSAGLVEGEARGLAEGIEQGFSNGIRQTARLMKQAACDTDFIVKMTGLSIEEIEAL